MKAKEMGVVIALVLLSFGLGWILKGSLQQHATAPSGDLQKRGVAIPPETGDSTSMDIPPESSADGRQAGAETWDNRDRSTVDLRASCPVVGAARPSGSHVERVGGSRVAGLAHVARGRALSRAIVPRRVRTAVGRAGD